MIHIDLLSKYRTELMGLSILLIMLFHSSFIFSNGLALHIERTILDELSIGCGGGNLLIFRILDIGVDFFSIISGFGLYRSLSKNWDIKQFYIKRFNRILPATLIVTSFYVLCHNEEFCLNTIKGVARAFLEITTLSTFRGHLLFWFITYILLCYVITPYLFRFINLLRRQSHSTLCLLLSVVLIYVLSYLVLPMVNPLGSMIYHRIPSFYVGLCIGLAIEKNCKCHTLIIHVLSIIGIFITIICRNFHQPEAIMRTCYFIFSLPILLSISHMFSCISWRHLHIMFSFLGGLTLELYLLHERFALYYCNTYISNGMFAVVLSFLLAIVGAYVYHKIIDNARKLLVFH